MMEKVMFGDTGYFVSRLGLGLAALGRPGYINLGHGQDLNHDYAVKHMMSNMHAVLDTAVHLGANYIDAAQSYGMSEDFLKEWLITRNNTTNDLIVGSKWGYTYKALWKVEAPEHEVKEHSLVVLNRQWNLSRKRLAPALSLFQIHSATLESGVLENTRILDRLAEIQDTGVLIGLSCSGEHQHKVIDRALKIVVEGKKLFDSVQLTYNILEANTLDAIKAASDAGLGVIIKEGLANGLLTQKNTMPQYTDLLTALNKIAISKNVGVDAVALAYILHQNSAHLVLSGATTCAQFASNHAARKISLSHDEMKTLSQFKMSSSAYWKQRASLKWN